MMPEDRKRLYALLEQWTRAEIMSRHAPLGWVEYGEMYFNHVELANQIRELLYGTSNLVDLGMRWGLLKPYDKKKKKEEKARHA